MRTLAGIETTLFRYAIRYRFRRRTRQLRRNCAFVGKDAGSAPKRKDAEQRTKGSSTAGPYSRALLGGLFGTFFVSFALAEHVLSLPVLPYVCARNENDILIVLNSMLRVAMMVLKAIKGAHIWSCSVCLSLIHSIQTTSDTFLAQHHLNDIQDDYRILQGSRTCSNGLHGTPTQLRCRYWVSLSANAAFLDF